MNEEPRQDMNISTIITNLKNEISKSIVGYEENIIDMLNCLISNGHMIVEGVPGIGKTTLAKTFARACDLSFNRIQFTQDLLPSDIVGYNVFNQETRIMELRKGPIFTELLLADEINRSPPKVQSALLESMQERQVTIEGSTLMLPDVFLVMATINPIETEGVYPLPEAQIDRFMMKIKMNYLNESEEERILSMKGLNRITSKQVISRDTISHMRKEANNIYVHKVILSYIREITRATRTIKDLDLGLSPRGGIHILRTAMTNAYLSGRTYVIPDDIKAVVHKVIDHRLILSPEAELEDIKISEIIDSLLSSISVPKGDFQRDEDLKE